MNNKLRKNHQDLCTPVKENGSKVVSESGRNFKTERIHPERVSKTRRWSSSSERDPDLSKKMDYVSISQNKTNNKNKKKGGWILVSQRRGNRLLSSRQRNGSSNSCQKISPLSKITKEHRKGVIDGIRKRESGTGTTYVRDRGKDREVERGPKFLFSVSTHVKKNVDVIVAEIRQYDRKSLNNS